MKKFRKVIIPIIMVVAIVLLSVSLYHTSTALKAAEADIAGMTFTEGKVVESGSGGVVTVSLKKAVYYESDDFITENKAIGKPLEDVFCSLHTRGYILGFDNSLAKVVYSKQLIVKESGTEKCYYLVGDYYIAINQK